MDTGSRTCKAAKLPTSSMSGMTKVGMTKLDLTKVGMTKLDLTKVGMKKSSYLYSVNNAKII